MLLYIVVGILLVIVLVFGLASSAQSYATAEQARAQIELAQVAQLNAWGNLIVVLVLALLIVSLLALALWIVMRRLGKAGRRNIELSHIDISADQPKLPVPSVSPAMLESLIQIEMLRLLNRMNSTPSLPSGSTPETEERSDDLSWLRRP